MPAATAKETRQTVTEAKLGPEITTPTSPRAKELQDIQRRDEEARSAIEDMARAEPIKAEKVTHSQDTNYSFRKADGSIDSTTYSAQRIREEAAVNEMVDFLDNGNYTDAIGEKILTDLLRMPEIKNFLESLQGGTIDLSTTPLGSLDSKVQDSVKRLAMDAGYQSHLRDGLNGALEGSIASQGEALGALERARNEARRKWDEANTELDHLNDTSVPPHADSLKAKKEVLRGYTETRGGYAPADPPTNYAEKIAHGKFNFNMWTNQVRDLTQERGAAVAAKAKLEVEKAQLEELGVARTAAQNARLTALTTVDIPAQEGLITAKNTAIAPIQADLDEYNDLIRQRDALQTEVTTTIPQRINQLTGEVFTLNETYQNAEKAFDDATKAFERSVNDRADTFDNMIGKEAGVYLRRDIQETVTRERVRLQTAIEEAKAAGDKVKADLLSSLDTRWESSFDRRRGILRRVKIEKDIDPRKVEPDIRTLLSGGKEEYIKRLFKNPNGTWRKNPDTGADYTDIEVAEKMTNPVFVKEVADESIHRLLSAGLRTGAVNKDNAQLILRTSWGVDAMRNAREWNKAIDEQIKLFEKESGHKVLDLAKKHPKIGLWLLLMLLSPGLGTIVGAGVLSAGVLKGVRGEKKEGGH